MLRDADLDIRPATFADAPAIWEIFQAVVSRGDTYAFDPATPFDDFLEVWMRAGQTYVAIAGGKLLGTYLLKPVQPGLGSHIANAGYMTHPEARGCGIGTALCRHSLDEARRLGYRGMQSIL